jgi:hypothetical protein
MKLANCIGLVVSHTLRFGKLALPEAVSVPTRPLFFSQRQASRQAHEKNAGLIPEVSWRCARRSMQFL